MLVFTTTAILQSSPVLLVKQPPPFSPLCPGARERHEIIWSQTDRKHQLQLLIASPVLFLQVNTLSQCDACRTDVRRQGQHPHRSGPQKNGRLPRAIRQRELTRQVESCHRYTRYATSKRGSTCLPTGYNIDAPGGGGGYLSCRAPSILGLCSCKNLRPTVVFWWRKKWWNPLIDTPREINVVNGYSQELRRGLRRHTAPRVGRSLVVVLNPTAERHVQAFSYLSCQYSRRYTRQ